MAKKQKQVDEKYNYAICRSAFGDYWVGKTLLPVKPGSIYDNIEDATEEAKSLTEADFEDSEELDFKLIELEQQAEEDCEIIKPEMEHWIIHNH